MKILERKHIDIDKWDLMVEKSNGECFSKSAYLDAVAENWCIYVDDNYSMGIALPFLKRFGVKCLYTPVFLRYVEPLNFEWTNQHFNFIKKDFKQGNLNIKLSGSESNKRFQFINNLSEITLNDQAKRMLKKFEKSGFNIIESHDTSNVLQMISKELSNKIAGLNDKSMKSLACLTLNLRHQKLLHIFEVYHDANFNGGAFFIEDKQRIIYLKSAFSDHAKKSGLMYALIVKMIEKAKNEDKTFDFGGSNVENVRNFNLHFGAQDAFYSTLIWDNNSVFVRMMNGIVSMLKAMK